MPDPASRFQPEGPHGPSQVVDPSAYRWADGDWRGPASVDGQVIYELHVGTFTPEGTWAAGAEQLPYLADLGVTAIEVMPVAEFPGTFGWGYDGVDLFAPYHGYGTPDDFRRFVDRAHGLGLAVLLDVVYNHLGPDGNYLKSFSDDYFSKRHKTEWGEALNFDGENAGPVREFVLANAGYWVDEFHVDGLRVDATQSIFDEGPDHILGAIVRTVARGGRGPSCAARRRERDPECAAAPACRAGRFRVRHALERRLPPHRDGRRARGTARRTTATTWALRRSSSPCSSAAGSTRASGTSARASAGAAPALDIPPAAFCTFTQNHDQVANSARGDRLAMLISPARYRAFTALQLLGPSTPLLFQGQEYAAFTPFLYFGDHEPELAAAIHQGRLESFRQFPSLATEAMQARLPNPADPRVVRCGRSSTRTSARGARTPRRWRCTATSCGCGATTRCFAFSAPARIDGAVLGPEALVLRWFGPGGDDRLLLVNLGAELRLEVAPEPLLAPPAGKCWQVLWSSEDPRYGGGGTPPPESEAYNWRLKGHSAVAMAPVDAVGDTHRDPPGSA